LLAVLNEAHEIWLGATATGRYGSGSDLSGFGTPYEFAGHPEARAWWAILHQPAETYVHVAIGVFILAVVATLAYGWGRESANAVHPESKADVDTQAHDQNAAVSAR
jgi:hypothetical protein